MLFLLCPHPIVLCSLSATTFHYVPENPRPPVTPDLKPKMVGGAGQTRDRGYWDGLPRPARMKL